jgi:hypothetical protein
MTSLVIAETTLRAFAFIVLYTYIGFGPGFILGILVANAIFGRGAPTYADTHRDAIRAASQHNAQWDPSHERWQKSE